MKPLLAYRRFRPCEVRQSINIASAAIEASLGAEYNKINIERATNADFAKLYAKMAEHAGENQ